MMLMCVAESRNAHVRLITFTVHCKWSLERVLCECVSVALVFKHLYSKNSENLVKISDFDPK